MVGLNFATGFLRPDGQMRTDTEIGVPLLLQALLDKGYGEALVRKIAMENWLGVLERTWG